MDVKSGIKGGEVMADKILTEEDRRYLMSLGWQKERELQPSMDDIMEIVLTEEEYAEWVEISLKVLGGEWDGNDH